MSRRNDANGDQAQNRLLPGVEGEMEARIEFVCAVNHNGEDISRDGPTITLNEKAWAYCSRGGFDKHRWERIPPQSISELRVKAHRTPQHVFADPGP
jgi:hypothetical protein